MEIVLELFHAEINFQFSIDKCPLETDDLKKLNSDNSESLNNFIYKYNPTLYLQYLNYTRRNIPPKIGSKVSILRNSNDIEMVQYVIEHK